MHELESAKQKNEQLQIAHQNDIRKKVLAAISQLPIYKMFSNWKAAAKIKLAELVNDDTTGQQTTPAITTKKSVIKTKNRKDFSR